MNGGTVLNLAATSASASASASKLFSTRLRAETQTDRAAAESTAYFRLLLAGALEPCEYAALLGQLHHVYTELERAGQNQRHHPTVAPFVDVGRSRVAALEDDLLALVGPAWQQAIPAIEATRAYCDRIREATTTPTGFIAHHYVRYVGDLTGGQFIGDAVSKVYGLRATGASFYRLPAGGDGRSLKQNYRHLLDTAPLSAGEQERVVCEARAALRHNAAVTTELGQWVASAAEGAALPES